jgi:hypothetical protein
MEQELDFDADRPTERQIEPIGRIEQARGRERCQRLPRELVGIPKRELPCPEPLEEVLRPQEVREVEVQRAHPDRKIRRAPDHARPPENHDQQGEYDCAQSGQRAEPAHCSTESLGNSAEGSLPLGHRASPAPSRDISVSRSDPLRIGIIPDIFVLYQHSHLLSWRGSTVAS